MTPKASEPLTPEDLSMLYSDQPRQRTTMSMLLLLDSRPQPDRLRAAVWRAVEAIPRMRQRVVPSPLDIALPRWEDDSTFDLDFHVRHIGLPPPGNDQQLAELVSRIIARPLDRSRPLWELYIIEGLDNGYVAQLTKMHHCTIDGVSGAEILGTLLDLGPEPRKVDPPRRAWRPDPEATSPAQPERGGHPGTRCDSPAPCPCGRR